MKRSLRNNKRYFTLVEMVVAISLVFFVGLIIGVATVSFYNGYKRAQKHAVIMREYRNIDKIMDHNVRNMIPFNWPDRDNNNAIELIFEGKADSIHFTTIRRNYGSNSAFLFIRLTLDDGNLLAEYSPYPRLPDLEDSKGLEYSKEIIAGSIDTIYFLYAEKDSSGTVEWTETWEEDDHSTIPLAVQMTILWKDGRQESWLRRTAGAGAYSTFGTR